VVGFEEKKVSAHVFETPLLPLVNPSKDHTFKVSFILPVVSAYPITQPQVPVETDLYDVLGVSPDASEGLSIG
jgi:hypothetical protein